MADPYSILGVKKNASADEIRSAYRKLAKTLHPDLHPGDKSAEEKFKTVSAAYDLLGDAEKRARFDRGEIDEQGNERSPFAGARGGGGRTYARGGRYADANSGEDMSDFFESFFGGFQSERGGPGGGRGGAFRARGPDVRYRVEVEFLDAVLGGKQRVNMPNKKALEVVIPPGVESGQTLRLSGQGEPGFNGGIPGDALFEVTVKPHPFLTRDGFDLRMDLPISLAEAVEGAQIAVPTPSGVVNLTIRSGVHSGSVLRLRGKGAPNGHGTHGDLLVRVMIHLLDTDDEDLRGFLKQWKNRDKKPPRPSSL